MLRMRRSNMVQNGFRVQIGQRQMSPKNLPRPDHWKLLWQQPSHLLKAGVWADVCECVPTIWERSLSGWKARTSV